MQQLITIILVLFAVMQGVQAEIAEPPPALEVIYVANEGFLIESAGKKIAIDVFFGGYESQWYYMPPDSAVEQMKTASPPFDDIDLIAVTHAHRDHFDAAIMAAHLRSNKNAILICPPQAEEKLKETEHFEKIRKRIRAIPTPGDSVMELEIGNIDILVFPTAHGKYMETDTTTGEKVDRHRNVQHLEYLFTIGERKLFHCGDSAFNHFLLYRSCGLDTMKIDVAFLQGRPRGLVRPAYIVLMHRTPGRTPSDPADYFQEGVKRVVEAREPMRTWRFD